jgi:beta-lactamase class D
MRRMKTCLLLLALATAGAASPDRDLSRYFEEYDGAFLLTRLDGIPLIRHNAPKLAERFAPCSTFKIPNSLIGLETGVIPDTGFKLPWDGTRHDIADWNRDHTLASAFAVSAVWYYQELARRVGIGSMQRWVERLNYGNRNLTGGITRFWLGSSLKISANEQVAFLRKLMKSELPASERSMRLVREIMIASAGPRAVLRGKTGTDWDHAKKKAILGWYVGAVSHPRGVYVFAANITGGKDPSGRTARGIVRKILTAHGLL